MPISPSQYHLYSAHYDFHNSLLWILPKAYMDSTLGAIRKKIVSGICNEDSLTARPFSLWLPQNLASIIL